MWILSQEKDSLVKTKSINAAMGIGGSGIVYSKDKDLTLGYYATVERAEEVITEMIEFLNENYKTVVFEMPEE